MRKQGWELVLADYLLAKPEFRWGVNDCALWVSSFCDDVTGSDHARKWLGRYDDEAGALALMAERGYANPEAVADANLKPKSILLAGRGDCVLHPQGALGLCDGRRSYFLTEDRGLIAWPTLKCLKAWEI